MRDFLATALALAIIIATVWGALALLIVGVNAASTLGVPRGLLYFSAGICFAASYKSVGRWFADYCGAVWSKISSWVVWR
jgi:hypothetical protein